VQVRRKRVNDVSQGGLVPAPDALEQARRARASAVDDLDEAKRELREAVKRLAARERKLDEREERLQAQVRRIARRLEARRQGQHRLDALRGRLVERELRKGTQERKESHLARNEARVERRRSELDQRSAELQAKMSELARREADLRAREGELDRQAAELDGFRAETTQAEARVHQRNAELDRWEQELHAREAEVADLEPREHTVAVKADELAAWERKLTREAERQRKTADRLDRHGVDLAERERALARLGQSLLSRRDGETAPEPRPAPKSVAFTEGLEALRAAAKSVRPDE
jgi:chromosome segregation ATPase